MNKLPSGVLVFVDIRKMVCIDCEASADALNLYVMRSGNSHTIDRLADDLRCPRFVYSVPRLVKHGVNSYLSMGASSRSGRHVAVPQRWYCATSTCRRAPPTVV
ncbi:hypothetical protein AcW1_008109 [Taiwanofungus camphoratus]|nr:hypothetical protein AcW1_008109 [Antrodia cinnamomea]